jgi:hypothetical protein
MRLSVGGGMFKLTPKGLPEPLAARLVISTSFLPCLP